MHRMSYDEAACQTAARSDLRRLERALRARRFRYREHPPGDDLRTAVAAQVPQTPRRATRSPVLIAGIVAMGACVYFGVSAVTAPVEAAASPASPAPSAVQMRSGQLAPATRVAAPSAQEPRVRELRPTAELSAPEAGAQVAHVPTTVPSPASAGIPSLHLPGVSGDEFWDALLTRDAARLVQWRAAHPNLCDADCVRLISRVGTNTDAQPVSVTRMRELRSRH